jgi:CRP-like cAMP-binding protein
MPRCDEPTADPVPRIAAVGGTVAARLIAAPPQPTQLKPPTLGGYSAFQRARGNVEERLARWLLMTQDRIDGELGLTHEFIALTLGVRRAGVTGALQGFEAKGIIERARSSVIVKDRGGLVQAANGLYGPQRMSAKAARPALARA